MNRLTSRGYGEGTLSRTRPAGHPEREDAHDEHDEQRWNACSSFSWRNSQNGYIVNSLEQAIESWRTLDVGPWIKLPTMMQPMNNRGVAVEPEITIGFAKLR